MIWKNLRSKDNNSRSVKGIRNVSISIIASVITMPLSFIARTVFVYKLTTEYLGMDGLFSNILGVLALSELGINTAMGYALYSPLVKKDREKTKSIMRLYKRYYIAVGCIILIMGIILIPALPLFMKDKPIDMSYVRLCFLIYVTGQAFSYFFSYKRTLIECDQNDYILTFIMVVFRILTVILQVSILLVTGSYMGYLIVQGISTLCENILVSYVADRMYPEITEKEVQDLDEEEKSVLKDNIGALLFHNIGSKLVFSTDNIIISKFIGLTAIGLYSNYVLIIEAVKRIINKPFSSIIAGVGNLMADNSKIDSEDYTETVFYHVLFANAWIYGFAAVCLGCLIQPFINLWIGGKYLISSVTALLAVLCFYIDGMRTTVLIFKGASGFFVQDKYKPLIEGIVNIIVSIYLAKLFGVAGVIAGTIISLLCVSFWYEALVFFKNRYKKNPGHYFIVQIKLFLFNVFVFITCFMLCYVLDTYISGITLFIVKVIICLVIPNSLYILAFHRSEDYKYFKDRIVKYFKR